MGVREYDPGLGRFVSADPLEGDANDPLQRNRYPYVGNDPLSRYDLDGRQSRRRSSCSVCCFRVWRVCICPSYKYIDDQKPMNKWPPELWKVCEGTARTARDDFEWVGSTAKDTAGSDKLENFVDDAMRGSSSDVERRPLNFDDFQTGLNINYNEDPRKLREDQKRRKKTEQIQI